VRRKFDNIDVALPNGDVLRLGTYMGPDGELSLKLRIPSSRWHLSQMFRSAEGTDREDSKTIITLDRS